MTAPDKQRPGSGPRPSAHNDFATHQDTTTSHPLSVDEKTHLDLLKRAQTCPRDFVPAPGWWAVWQAGDSFLYRRVVGFATRYGVSGLAESVQPVVNSGVYGLSFVRDAYALWWDVNVVHEDDIGPCVCKRPYRGAPHTMWCVACGGDLGQRRHT